jgi:hypothetical protein
LNKFLASIGLAAALAIAAATPASAWRATQYFVRNNAQGTHLVIEGVTLEYNWFQLRPIQPGETSGFVWSPELKSCLVHVTISQWFAKPVTAPNLFNVCSQTTITITPKGPNNLSDFWFAYN